MVEKNTIFLYFMFRIFIFLNTDVYFYSIIYINYFPMEWFKRNLPYLSKYQASIKTNMIEKQQQQTNQWVLTPIQCNLAIL